MSTRRERKKTIVQEVKDYKQARKAEIRQMPKAEKRAAKKHDNIFRKVKARPRRGRGAGRRAVPLWLRPFLHQL